MLPSIMPQNTLLLVTTSFPRSGDGSEAAGSFVADLVTELARHTKVRVVAPGSEAQCESWTNRVEVFRYPAPLRPLSTLKPWRPDDLYWMVRVWHEGLRAARKAVTADTTNILALWGLPCGEWARCVAREYGIGYSVWLLGSDVWSLGRVPILRHMLRRLIRQASHAYADGYKLAADARRIAGIAVAFLPSARRTETIAIPPRNQPPYRLLFLGRWHLNKGVDLLLEALSLLGDGDWHNIDSIEIQGGGPLEGLVRERAAALHERGHPVEAGKFLSKVEAEAAITRADWVLIPSRVESIPVVFSDAIKLGRPVIATPVGDLDSLISQSGVGILAKNVTAGDFARALRQALASNAFEMSIGTCSLANQFDPAKIAGQLLADLDLDAHRNRA